uniref:Uncharacterized protein n=1 Tax=Arundo donax TaxID=35708 RepID=A0A0A8ZYZ9_ARUDO
MLMVGHRHKATVVDLTGRRSMKKLTLIFSDQINQNEVQVTITMNCTCTPFVVVPDWPFALFCGLYLESW